MLLVHVALTLVNFRVLSESSRCRFAQRNGSGEQTASWVTSHTTPPSSSWSGWADSCRARRRREEGYFPEESANRKRSTRTHPRALSLTGLLQDSGGGVWEGPESDKQERLYVFCFLKISNQFSDFRSILYLRGWSGQLDCTGVGTAELGLISMAL